MLGPGYAKIKGMGVEVCLALSCKGHKHLEEASFNIQARVAQKTWAVAGIELAEAAKNMPNPEARQRSMHARTWPRSEGFDAQSSKSVTALVDHVTPETLRRTLDWEPCWVQRECVEHAPTGTKYHSKTILENCRCIGPKAYSQPSLK